MGNISDGISNGIVGAASVIGAVTSGAAPLPNSGQLADAQEIGNSHLEISTSDIRSSNETTTSGK